MTSRRETRTHGFHADWVIVGAETGNRKGKAIPKRRWIEDIAKDCAERNIPLFMKESLAGIWGEPLIRQYPWEAGMTDEEQRY
jgi:hypothetical protein